MRADAERLLAPQFRAIVRLIDEPILQPIYDLESPRMAFGRVAVVGDAAFVARPHVAAGVSKAADDAAALIEALEGERDVAQALTRFEAARLPENHASSNARAISAPICRRPRRKRTVARRQAQHRRCGDRGDCGAGFSVCVSSGICCPVIAGLDPAIHDEVQRRQPYVRSLTCGTSSWMRGSSPRMTVERPIGPTASSHCLPPARRASSRRSSRPRRCGRSGRARACRRDSRCPGSRDRRRRSSPAPRAAAA